MGAACAARSADNAAAKRIVFIDSAVPDRQILVDALQPGADVVVLDPSTDGVRQIALYRRLHDLRGLDSVSIVAHGSRDELRLGSIRLNMGNVAAQRADLAEIGAALRPNGSLFLYGCDVAGAAGRDRFLSALALATGVANISASSHLVGTASKGGGWLLNARVGSAEAALPFRAESLGAYPDLLTVPSALVWYTSAESTTSAGDTGLFRIDVNGSSAATNAAGVDDDASSLNLGLPWGVAIDPVNGVYFVVDESADVGGAANVIFKGNLNGSGTPQVIYTSGNSGNDTIVGIAIDPANEKLYFAVTDENFPGPDTGIYSIGESGGIAADLVNLGSSVGSTTIMSPDNIAIDPADNLLFFTNGFNNGGIQSSVEAVEVANLTTGAILNSSLETYSAVGTTQVSGIAVDPASHKLYWTTIDASTSSNDAIYGATFSTGATPALSGITTLYTTPLSTSKQPSGVGIDPANGFLYATTNASQGSPSDESVYEGSTSGSGSLTSIYSLPNEDAGFTTANDLVVETQPALAASGTVNAVEGGSSVIIDSGVTVSNSNGFNLASATVTISSGFVAGDTLGFDGGSSSEAFSGATIVASYNASTGVLTLSGSATAADYQTALDSVLFATSSSSTTATSRTIDWTVSDGFVSSSTPTSTVSVHVAPAVTAGGTVTFTGGGSAVTLDSALVVSDASSASLVGATVLIGSGKVSGDTLNFTNQSGITGSYNASTGTLTLAGTATLTNYEAALRSVTYSFSPSDGDPTNGGSHTSRTLSWTVNDGTLSSQAATSTLEVTHLAPSIGGASTVTFDGGGGALILDSSLSAIDVDSGGNLAGATVEISAGFLSGDTLNFTNQNGISGSYNASTGVLTLSGTASIADYQAALESVSYLFSPSDGDPTNGGADTSRTLSWTVTDGTDSSLALTTTLDATHVAPTVTAGGTVTYVGGGAAVTLDSALATVDVDSGGNLDGATVSISTGFLSGDSLNFTNQNGITGAYNPSTGVLTLSGTSSVTNYQTALQSITYSFSGGGDPTNGGADTSRTLSWSISDSSSVSNVSASTLDEYVAPVVTAGGAATFIGGGGAVVLDAGLTVSDVSSATLEGATASITVGFVSGDTLNFTNQNGITGSYNPANGILILSGTSSIANYQSALESVTFSFSPTDGDPTVGDTDPSRTISWIVSDGTANSAVDTSAVATTHAAPSVSAGVTTTFVGGGPPVTLDAAATTTDADSGGNLAGATVAISTGFLTGDMLNFTNQNGITGTYNAATGTLTLSGTASVADYEAALDSISYSFTPGGDPTNGGTDTGRTLSWSVTDGTASSNTATTVLDTTHVAPVVAPGGGATPSYSALGSAVVVDSGVTVNDVDSPDLVGATVTISTGFLAGDSLNFINQNGITGNYDGSSGTLTLSGSASVANYQAALQSFTFSSSSSDPTNAGADLDRQFQFQVSDGTAVSNAVTDSVNVENSPTLAATHAVSFVDGYFFQITETITYGGTPARIDWQLTLPAGWQYISDNGSVGDVQPAIGATGVLDWQWTTSIGTSPSPISFSYVVEAPFGSTGTQMLLEQASVNGGSGVDATPDPLTVNLNIFHSADSSHADTITVAELTRVVALFNTRSGTVLTGCYLCNSSSVDGFDSDPSRPSAAAFALPYYHSADFTNQGHITVAELTRVVALFNYRNGTVLTGQYHVDSTGEDGFNPGP